MDLSSNAMSSGGGRAFYDGGACSAITARFPSVVSCDMTVIALWCEKTRKGPDYIVLSDQRRLGTDLETGETSILSDGILKSVALSDTCCVACAGSIDVSRALMCHLADRKEWLERLEDDSFDPAREIESLPERVGLSVSEAAMIVDEQLPELLERQRAHLAVHGREDMLKDTSIYVVGRDDGRIVHTEWTAKTEFGAEREERTPESSVTLSWPDDYDSNQMREFMSELAPGKLPLHVRAAKAIRYANAQGMHASREFSLRCLSERFDLFEG